MTLNSKTSSANPGTVRCVFSADVHEAGGRRGNAISKRVIKMQFIMLETQLLYEIPFAFTV